MSTIRGITAALGLLAFGPAEALDLAEAYRLALATDPSYQAVAARAAADEEGIGIARAKLLPQLGASGTIRKMWTKREVSGRALPAYQTNSWNWGVNLVQPLYRPSEWAAYQQAKDLARSSRMRLTDERDNLLARLAQAYLQVLDVSAQLNVARTDLRRHQAVLRQAKAAFANGDGTRTDVEEAQARLDEADARVIHWQGRLEIAQQRLSLLVGQSVRAAELVDLADRHSVARTVLARQASAWVEEARQANAGLKALRAEVEAARRKVQQAWGGHKPTLDFVAGYRQSSSDSEITLNQTFKTGTVGLQASLPIFSGGGTAAAIRQAQAQLQEAQFRLDARSLEIRQMVLDAYTRVRAGESEVKARRQALSSARQALTATRKGVLAGTRNTVDVLDAEQRVSEAEARYADAVYQLLQAVVELLVAVSKPPEEAIRFVTGVEAPDPAPDS